MLLNQDLTHIERVAADARPLVEAFRARGEPSSHKVGLDTARANYLTSCRANGPQPQHEISSSYTEIEGVTCRIYEPVDGPKSCTTLLFFHGGGWVIGDLQTHDSICRYLAGATSSQLISVDYRLAPEHKFPAAHDDAHAVAAAILSQENSAPVIVIGDSAGGNLAAWVAAAAATKKFNRQLAGQVLFYPVTDLTGSQPSYQQITRGYALTADTMRWFAETYAPPSQHAHPALSPLLYGVEQEQAPAFIVTVGLDPLADEGIAYAGQLAASGTYVEHLHLPRQAHGLISAAGVIATGKETLDRAVAFITARAVEIGENK